MIIAGREYIIGTGRNPGEEKKVAHLYEGPFGEPGNPMCARGWNRADGFSYSILRNVPSQNGLCKICLRRATEGKPAVMPRERKTEWI